MEGDNEREEEGGGNGSDGGDREGVFSIAGGRKRGRVQYDGGNFQHNGG